MSVTLGMLRVAPVRLNGARAVLLAVVAAGVLAGLLANDAGQTARMVRLDGDSLTRLMRAMAVIKLGLAGLALAAVMWRLQAAVAGGWLAGYAAAAGAAAMGPGLIWGLVHVVAGAVLLHGGLLALMVLLWRDPAVGASLAQAVAARRARLV